MTKFSKNPKKLMLGPFWALFCLNLGKNDFSWKKGLCQFSNIRIMYHRAKNQKKVITQSSEKCRTDEQTDR